MNLNTIKKCDQKGLSIKNWQIPYYWKKIGVAVFTLAFIGIFIPQFIDPEPIIVKQICKKAMLFGLLLITLAKEPIEDERLATIRSKAFSLAFIFGVVYALIQPVVNYIVGVVIEPEDTIYSDLGGFQILWFMLVIYVGFFHLFKRKE